MKKLYLLVAGFLLSGNFVFAQDNDPFAQTCTQAHAQADLDINNVRAAILANGNMWQSTIPGCTAGYTVPKNGTANSIFISGLWFGGLDDGGQLMTACMTYRQRGVDFWAGPIDTVNAATNKGVCWAYDRFWKLNRSEVEAFREHYSEASYTIPEAILTWPANGNTQAGYSKQQAPFIDNNGDGIYDPHAGDYPAFALNGQPNCNYNLLGDQAIWWVFNDKGNEHGETGGAPFGMEIQAMAFAYHTKDETDNATFYRYKIINRSTSSWNQMWMGQYTDTDLGAFDDDYIGCDVSRGMSYVYNGDLNDGSSALPTVGTYGAHPPAQGFDWLQGPLADANDMIDNNHDGQVDETGERVTMSMFKIFQNDDYGVTGNPQTNLEYYNYLKGFWKDGSHQTYGGNGYGGQVESMDMYPGDSDPYGWGTNGIAQPVWSEITEGNTPYDRRFLSSVGSFSMQPGEVQIVTVGLPWTRDTAATGTNLTSLEKLKQVDDQMQQLFESCFAMPCAAEASPTFSASVKDRQVYFTAESADGIYTWNFGDNTSASIKHPSHSYSENGTYNVCYTVTTSCGTQSYCALVKIDSYENDLGPKLQRLEGKGSGNQVIDFTPESVAEIFTSGENKVRYPWFEPLHAPVRVTYEDYNSLVDGDYRIAFDGIADTSGWKLWRVGSTDTIYSDSAITNGDKQIISQYGLGIRVKQVKNPGMNYNPDRNGYLGGSMIFSDPQKNWLSAVADKDESSSYNWIRGGVLNAETNEPCSPAFNDAKMGYFIDLNEDFEKWIGGTWSPYRIGAGLLTYGTPCYSTGVVFNNNATVSQTKIENVANVNIVITPDKTKWSRCAVLETGSNAATNENGAIAFLLRSHASVDKEGRTVAQGGLSDSLNPEAADYIGANGMGWFPGYAYNLETGERLNISFGENSSLPAENGRDMIWNPTSNEKTNLNQILFGGMHYIYVFGHNGDAVFPGNYSYAPLRNHLKDVPAYDNGKAIYDILHLADQGPFGVYDRGEVFRDAMWVNIPLLNPGHSLLESDATIRLRVAKPFALYNTSTVPENDNKPMYGFKIDKMNPGCNLYDGDVSVFPNPFTESCTILFDNTENKKYNLKLYDLQGRLVRRIDDVITDRIVIDALGLNSGVYIYSLETEGAKTKSGRIVLR